MAQKIQPKYLLYVNYTGLHQRVYAVYPQPKDDCYDENIWWDKTGNVDVDITAGPIQVDHDGVVVRFLFEDKKEAERALKILQVYRKQLTQRL